MLTSQPAALFADPDREDRLKRTGGLDRNQWPDWADLPGRIKPFSVAGLVRNAHYKPHKTEFEDTYLTAVALSKKLFDIGAHLDVELEGNIVRRFGDDDSWEFNAALFFRWDKFPWQDQIYTTVAIGALGPSYATGISDGEMRKSGNDEGSRLLHYMAPEITFSPPSNHDIAVIMRVHHRSGVFGLFDGVDGGSNFVSIGLRHYF